MSDFSDLWKQMMGAVPWQFKILWIVGALLSLSFLGGLFWLLVVLIKHFS